MAVDHNTKLESHRNRYEGAANRWYIVDHVTVSDTAVVVVVVVVVVEEEEEEGLGVVGT